MRFVLAMITGILLSAGAAPAADYRADLGPMPLDDETKAVIAGRGEAIATIVGDRVTIKGSFHGLPSSATAAHVVLSPVIGVPGEKLLSLEVAGTDEGTVTGSYRLTGSQLRALRAGRLYIQIDSEKAPPGYAWGPKGTLWGWLLPEHERVVPNVPQQGSWFIPQLDTGPR